MGLVDQFNHFCDIKMEVGYNVSGYNHTLHGVVVWSSNARDRHGQRCVEGRGREGRGEEGGEGRGGERETESEGGQVLL